MFKLFSKDEVVSAEVAVSQEAVKAPMDSEKIARAIRYVADFGPLECAGLPEEVIEGFLGIEALSPAELTDHHACRLGKWYDSISDAGIKNNSNFKALEEPHSEVHKFGKMSAEFYVKGDIVSAEAASDQVIGLLDKLIGEM